MKRTQLTLVTAAALATAACSDFLSSRTTRATNPDLAVAFATVPVGYSMAQTTYDQSAEGIGPFFPRGMMGGLGHGPGPGMGGGFGPMIGGGLGGAFLGGFGLGRDFGHGHHFGDPDLDDDDNCTFSAATSRVTCPPVTEHGLTITRSIAFTDATGKAQSAFDTATTNTINTRVTVTGTITRRDSATSVINNASDRTVGGLAKGSTQHTVNGTAAGNEVTTGKDSTGTFTATRQASDTVSGVVIPVSSTEHAFPTAGTIIRRMSVSVTRAGATTTSSRREVITYDGSSTAHLVVTQDGTTKTCTLPLPFGRPTCQ